MRFPRDTSHLGLAQSLPSIESLASILQQGRDVATRASLTIIKRQTTSTTSSSTATTTCESNANGNNCEKPANPSAALPIALGIVIPLLSATIVLLILHRRNKKRQRAQDQKDAEKYRSLDFGMDLDFANGGGKKKQGGKRNPNERPGQPQPHTRGMSVDALNHGPYMMAGNNDYAASLVSLSRMTDDVHNPYRQADAMSIRAPSPSVRGFDGDSVRTGRTNHSGNSSIPHRGSGLANGSNTSLLGHQQPIPRSMPLKGTKSFPRDDSPSGSNPKELEANVYVAELPAAPAPAFSPLRLDINDKSMSVTEKPVRNSNRMSNNYLGTRISTGSDKLSSSPPKIDSGFATLVNSPVSENSMPKSPLSISDMPLSDGKPALPPLPTFTGLPTVCAPSAANETTHNYHQSMMSETSDYGEWNQPRESTYTSLNVPGRGQSLAPTKAMPEIQEDFVSDYYDNSHSQTTLSVADSDWDNRRLSVMQRPLPPDDPEETPEARATRIRSFYKEYFDKNDDEEQPPMPPKHYQVQAGDYYEDYHQEYMNHATVMDQQRGFIVAGAPYAEPVTRRAMTPPPRAPPRFRSGTPNGGRSGPPSSVGSVGGPHGQPQYYSRSRTQSQTSRFDLPPRGQSAMSQQRGRTPNRRPMPPPTALTSLPTPHMLKDDAAFLATTIDFAPPASYRDLQSGRRPDSPLGTARPYSPSVRSFNPLASSYDDLNVMPSPHSLRKSGTFTALDFAPPRRINGGDRDTSSDNGSIRSGRSGRSNISNVHAYNVRNGAYRVSKIPKELAGTRNELAMALKPSWEQR